MAFRFKTLVAGLALATLAGSAALAQQFTIKISSPTVADMTQAWMTSFKAGVETRAAGKIKVELYPSGQLGSIPATVEGTALGTIEMVACSTGFLAGLEPRFLALEAPGLFDDLAHAHRVLRDPEIVQRLSGFGKSKGIEPLAVFGHGPLMALSHKPIRSVADFAAQKIRVPGAGPLYVEPMRQLKASPISMPLGEVLPAMQNKGIDGFVAGSAIFTSMKFHDIAKSLTELPGGIIAVGAVINSDFLKSLGPELGTIVREEAQKAYADSVDWSLKDSAAALDAWRKNGGEVISLSADEAARYRELVTSILPKFLEGNGFLKADHDALVAASKRQRR